ncbi:AAA family ATPase [Aquipuribacter hungaricus]|uniref:AAA family ATPase n=1 Tax=Aquipuribacter hungaricus TaxID=545624 RepID=A0ABV7WI16_9MICO
MDTSGWGLPVRRLERDPAHGRPSSWAARVPAVAQVLDQGWDLGPATVLVGENGAGKSTLVEALAGAAGLDVRGGSTNTAGMGGDAHPDPLAGALRVRRGAGAARWGFFLRAETMHGVFDRVHGSRDDPDDFHAMSHGESFLSLLGTRRFSGSGLYVLDEPESALSFTSCLSLVGVLHDLVATGTAQVVVATHSPVLAALPGADLLVVDGDGLTPSAWEDLPLVAHWRTFMDDPRRYLRHVVP